jgi:hypothetical protein
MQPVNIGKRRENVNYVFANTRNLIKTIFFITDVPTKIGLGLFSLFQ